jgi:hypothetical protein
MMEISHIQLDNKIRSGGKPAFPTLETFKPESLSLNYQHLTGQEGRLAPALLRLFSTLFYLAI